MALGAFMEGMLTSRREIPVTAARERIAVRAFARLTDLLPGTSTPLALRHLVHSTFARAFAQRKSLNFLKATVQLHPLPEQAACH